MGKRLFPQVTSTTFLVRSLLRIASWQIVPINRVVQLVIAAEQLLMPVTTSPMMGPADSPRLERPITVTNNSGPTQTIALSPSSSAIDVIPLGGCTDQNRKRLKTDQRGFPRPEAEEQRCSIGAYEFQAACSDKQQGNSNCQ